MQETIEFFEKMKSNMSIRLKDAGVDEEKLKGLIAEATKG
jgi:hypothetical protein